MQINVIWNSALILTVLFCLPYFIGYGVLDYILPASLRRFQFWLTPWFGYLLLVFILVATGFSDIPINTVNLPVTVIFSLISFLVIIRRKRLNWDIKKGVVLSLMLASVGFNLLPLYQKSALNTAVSMGNLDVASYASCADSLQNSTLAQIIHRKNKSQALYLISGDYRWGPSLLLSFFSSVLKVPSYRLSFFLPVIMFALTIPLVGCLIELVSRPSYPITLLAMIQTALNANLLYMLYHVFFGQIIFTGLLALLFIFIFDYYRNTEKEGKMDLAYEILISFILTTIYFSFHEGLIFFFAMVIVYGSYQAVIKRNMFCLKSLARILFILILLAPASFIHNTAFIQDVLTSAPESAAAIGWAPFRTPNPYAAIFEFFSFRSPHTHPALPFVFSTGASFIAMFFILYGIKNSRNNILALVSLLIFGFSLVYYRYYHPHYFLYNRVLTMALPLLIVFFCTGLSVLSKKSRVFFILLLPAFILLLKSAKLINQRFLKEMYTVRQEIITLGGIPRSVVNRIIETKSFYFVNLLDNAWDKVWALYFIKPDFMFHIGTNSKDIYEKTEGRLALFPKSDNFCLSAFFTNDIWQNKNYGLADFCYDNHCLISSTKSCIEIEPGLGLYDDLIMESGWSSRESDGRWADAPRSTLRFFSSSNHYQALSFTARTLQEPQAISVIFNDQLLGKINPGVEWQEFLVPLPDSYPPGIFRIAFEFEKQYQPSALGISQDERTLSAAFREIKLLSTIPGQALSGDDNE